MEERSLDEFLAGDDSSSEGDDEVDGSAPETATDTDPDGETEPATATSRVAPEGENCDSCGESVSRLWVGDGEELCRSCVEW